VADIKDFKDFTVWKESSRFAVDIYKLCKKLPDSEKYGLTSQMQRAAVSIPSNIAEGYRRNGKKEFKHFLYIALGSAAELETQLYIFSEIYQEDLSDYLYRIISIQKMLNGLIKTLS
jgi:four helix bundle protein